MNGMPNPPVYTVDMRKTHVIMPGKIFVFFRPDERNDTCVLTIGGTFRWCPSSSGVMEHAQELEPHRDHWFRGEPGWIYLAEVLGNVPVYFKCSPEPPLDDLWPALPVNSKERSEGSES